jgi:uncharacterized membrane protein
LFLLVFSLGLSWQVNKSVNFFYSFWYPKLNIEQTIKTYVPQNTQGKQDFAKTTSEQHQQSFSEIVDKIHNNASELPQLSYLNEEQQKRILLTSAEVLHLQDVSELITKLRIISAVNLLLLLCTAGIIYQMKLPKPQRKSQYIAVTVPSVLLIVSFSIYGFNDIFYYLHTVVFPDNHQWFFYYQESLMSSLMKAPDLFAAIGLSLVIITFIFYWGLYLLLAPKIFKNKSYFKLSIST